ncbi:putative immunity protein [Actinotalea sp. K2]|uniref:putative immunity protein n=1 Tax=Actinotalea sp. K2 TaxID=2939438 RepID=UPI002016FF9C|nr:exonuclease SbcC [Actinotalea sp. K2]MCL3862065.1 exonuclease SbcC [Actinotalea sp. K2]
MTASQGDFALTLDELRVVARYTAECALEALPVFEAARPGDSRARAATDAAWEFVHGAPRSNLQRATALDAHRAAKDATTPAAHAAARAAGDAAASAYLHPLAKPSQVGHILRAAGFAARALELAADDDDQDVAAQVIERARRRASPTLVEVLRRYPPAPEGKNRVDQLWKTLDAALRPK